AALAFAESSARAGPAPASAIATRLATNHARGPRAWRATLVPAPARAAPASEPNDAFICTVSLTSIDVGDGRGQAPRGRGRCGGGPRLGRRRRSPVRSAVRIRGRAARARFAPALPPLARALVAGQVLVAPPVAAARRRALPVPLAVVAL